MLKNRNRKDESILVILMAVSNFYFPISHYFLYGFHKPVHYYLIEIFCTLPLYVIWVLFTAILILFKQYILILLLIINYIIQDYFFENYSDLQTILLYDFTFILISGFYLLYQRKQTLDK
jgi:hypothetical protein